MKRIILFLLFIVIFLVAPTYAETEMSNLGVRVIRSSERYTYYSWKVDVNSDTSKKSCMLKISFRDADGFELTSANDIVTLSPGTNHLTGQGMCKKEIWNQIEKYTAKMNCY